MKYIVWVAVIAILIPAVFAQTGSVKLLALAETGSGVNIGAVADLELRVEPGDNRVYLETFPLTKITTQISMRFAEQIACKELDIDCSNKDFFFTIKALPGIVGGPSAGSAAAVLTASLITGIPLRNDTAITGTINSGGIIGPVGGLREKITAAATSGMTRVLIPRGTSQLTDNETNATTDLVKYGKIIGVDVIEVSTLLDAMHEYTGRDFPRFTGNLSIEPAYEATMKEIAIDLCNRTEKIKSALEKRRNGFANTTEIEQQAVNMSQRAEEAFNASQYYASASFCFRSNVGYKAALAVQRNWTGSQVVSALDILRENVANYSGKVDSIPIRTLTELQTFMSVKERLFETEDILVEILKNISDVNESAQSLGYAEERLFSAKTWARFFNENTKTNDKKFAVDNSSLRNSCLAKASEAEERINYVKTILPDSLSEARKELDRAYQDLSEGNYTLCLYKASKTKAEADTLLSLMGVERDRIDELIDLKLEIAKEAVVRSQQKGVFPIIGYSYYEYAITLKPIDKYSALLFSEYALEFSNFDMYFPRAKSSFSTWKTVEPHFIWILAGITLGIIISLFIDTIERWLDEKQKKKKR